MTDVIVNDSDIRRLIKLDPIFARIFNTYGPPPNWSRPEGFVSLSRIILEQQVSLASANAHYTRLDNYLPEFTPAEILKLSDEEMRECHISRQKASYLRALSTAIIKGKIDLEQLPHFSKYEIRKQLTSVKGIGEWTTDIYLMFCLQAKDIFPLGDIAVINTIRELKLLQSREEIALYSEKWEPIRSLAAYFLWHYYLCKRSKNTVP